MVDLKAQYCSWLCASGAALLVASQGQAQEPASVPPASDDRFATFMPYENRIQHRIDYSIWTSALSNFVISMGPPLRKKPFNPPSVIGTRRQIGHNSIYRLDGSMVAFSFMNDEVRESFTEYRRDLESVADTLDIQSIPRNEQLAYWLNLHNVAMVEQIAKNWPVRQPHEIEIGGVPLDEAKFITVEGVALSPRDIRERIVYPNWKNPKVIYGFWRGEIGGPAMQRQAFDGRQVGDQLDRAAREFMNSRRGTEKRGSTLHVSRFFEEAAPFYFRNFEADLRRHLADYVEGEVLEMLEKTSAVEASLRERDIADLAGGARDNGFFSGGRISRGVAILLAQRRAKLDYVDRKGLRQGQVIFSNIDLPGDPPNKGEVE
ncbi:DUF547 domain-containing protein [Erythrobacter sp. THAF29]|uniref:DUF547 domain-containing protein n=1 Tax=Erythrobacter sp. THAF29 TaxID=2587851 RepID=UPI001267C4DE|nr:DUF547 domain-containing protein [Erythrobacter sp. THAF29]QFT78746.1 hypothetical protein FIU90_14445 [Erythrobacter sp. THAF29]